MGSHFPRITNSHGLSSRGLLEEPNVFSRAPPTLGVAHRGHLHHLQATGFTGATSGERVKATSLPTLECPQNSSQTIFSLSRTEPSP